METFGLIVAWTLSIGCLLLAMAMFFGASMASRAVTSADLRAPRLFGIAGLVGVVLLVVFS